MTNFWKNILSPHSTLSSKRLITLIISMHFIVASFSILFIAFYVIFYLPRGHVDPTLLGLLKEVLEYDFYIILSGLGFVTADNLGQMMLEKAKSKAGNITTEVNSKTTDPIPPNPPD